MCVMYCFNKPSFDLCKAELEPEVYKITVVLNSLFQLLGFGLSILDGIDPNPDNFVSSGILHTRNQQIGCLVRLEPNRQAEVSRPSVDTVLFLACSPYCSCQNWYSST